MATVTITLTDAGGEEVDVRIESDPPLDGSAKKNPKYTAAQNLAAIAVMAISNACKGGGEVTSVEGD